MLSLLSYALARARRVILAGLRCGLMGICGLGLGLHWRISRRA